MLEKSSSYPLTEWKTANVSECGKNTKWRQVLFISTFQFLKQENVGVRKKKERMRQHFNRYATNPVGLGCGMLGIVL